MAGADAARGVRADGGRRAVIDASTLCPTCDGAGAVWEGDDLVPCECVLAEDMPASRWPTTEDDDDADE
jgi:hypothetical protein